MFVIVVGGGRIGFYLTKELLAEGHEIVLMEKDPRAAERIRDATSRPFTLFQFFSHSWYSTCFRVPQRPADIYKYCSR